MAKFKLNPAKEIDPKKVSARQALGGSRGKNDTFHSAVKPKSKSKKMLDNMIRGFKTLGKKKKRPIDHRKGLSRPGNVNQKRTNRSEDYLKKHKVN